MSLDAVPRRRQKRADGGLWGRSGNLVLDQSTAGLT
jgi:hypothetical protein